MSIILPLLALSALAPGTSPGARAEEPPAGEAGEVIMWVAGRPETCNRRVARHLSFDDFVLRHASLRGRCVAVRGWWVGRALLRSRSDARDVRQSMSESLVGGRIGVYGRPEMMERAPSRPRPFTLVGIAGDCEVLGSGAVMVMGYCHYVGGPYIAIAQVHSRR